LESREIPYGVKWNGIKYGINVEDHDIPQWFDVMRNIITSFNAKWK